MGKQYRTLAVEVTAANTKTQLTNQGSRGDITPLLVPAGYNILESVIYAGAGNNATLGQAHAFIRLEGPALPDGPETLALTAIGACKILGQLSHMDAVEEGVGLRVTPNMELEVYAEMAGTVDPGQISVIVGLVFRNN